MSQLIARETKNIAVYLNFDMVGSPNYGRFIYDGDGGAFGTAGPNGSDIAEGVFEDYCRSQGLATLPTAFDGRSDYKPFIDAGIPAGGLFTGAEDIKTQEEAVLFGGQAGVRPVLPLAVRRHRQPEHRGPGPDVGRDGPRAADLRPDDPFGQRHRQGLGHTVVELRPPGLAPAEVTQAYIQLREGDGTGAVPLSSAGGPTVKCRGTLAAPCSTDGLPL